MTSRTTSKRERHAPVSLIQVGLGGWGRNWYETRLKGSPDAELAGFVDSSEEALEQLQADAGIKASACFTSVTEALEQVDAEAVLVTASLPGHVPAARAALEAGKHVLMEKPFAPSVADARALTAEAETAGRLLMISQNYRYFPAPQRAVELVSSGELGKLGVIDIEFRRNHLRYDPARSRHFALPDPLLADMAIHHFDLIRMISGADARHIRCHSYNPPWSHFTHHPSAEALIELEDDTVVTYRGSWVSRQSPTPWAGEWRMEFERGTVRFTSREDETGEQDRLWVRRDTGARSSRERAEPLSPLDAADRSGSLREFARCIRTGEKPATHAGANIGSIGLTYAAIEAARTGRRVDVER